MSINQRDREREHTAAITSVRTNVHGLIEGANAIGPFANEAEIKDIFDLGSGDPTGVSAASGKEREMIALKLRSSKLNGFLQGMLDFFELDQTALRTLHLRMLEMTLTITKAPFDEDNNPMPVETKDVTVIYAGFREDTIDRGTGSEILYYNVMLKPASAVVPR